MIPGLSLGSFALGLLAGAGGLYAYQAYTGAPTTANGAPASLGAPRDVLHGRIVPGPTAQLAPGPARVGTPPRAGVATVMPYEWAYVVGDGDTAGSIAAAITGDESRYVDLMLANPAVMAVGEPGLYFGPSEWQPAPGALSPGLVLLMPMPWDRYIDQVGHVRGGPIPFPPDGSGVFEDVIAAATSLGPTPEMTATLPPAAVHSTPIGGLASSTPVGTGGAPNGGAQNQHVRQMGGAQPRYTPPNPYYDEQGRWRGRRAGPPAPIREAPQTAAPYGTAFVPGGG